MPTIILPVFLVALCFALLQLRRRADSTILNSVHRDRFVRQTGNKSFSGSASFENCSTTSDCAQPRKCYDDDNLSFGSFTICNSNSTFCSCLSLPHWHCSSSTDCLGGDQCIDNGQNADCVSCDLSVPPGFDVVDGGNCDGDPWTGGDGNGLSGDFCNVASDCMSPRFCYFSEPNNLNSSSRFCSKSDPRCYCLNLDHFLCLTSADCLLRHRCFKSTSGYSSVCLSCEFSGIDYTPVDEGNCDISDASIPQSPTLSTVGPFSSPSASPSGETKDRGTQEFCTENSDCAAPRSCYYFSGNPNEERRLCTSSDVICRCLATSYLYCFDSSQCLNGDRCFASGVNRYCFSCIFEEQDELIFVDEGNCNNDSSTYTTPTPEISEFLNSSSPVSRSPAPSLETPTESLIPSLSPVPSDTPSIIETPSSESEPPTVSKSVDATATASEEVEISPTPSNVNPTSQTEAPSSNTVDYSPSPGDVYDDVVPSPSENMVLPSDSIMSTASVSISASPSPSLSPVLSPSSPSSQSSPSSSPSASDGGICIAVDILEKYGSSSFVFKTHRQASVLCDAHENCATGGHMIVYKRVAMSMSTYCAMEHVECVRRVKFVNSPRMKLGLRIRSNLEELEFTALAASKDSKVEKGVLKLLISVGM